MVLTGVGWGELLPPQLWEPEEPQMGQNGSLSEEAAVQARSWEQRTERGGQVGLAAKTMLGAQQGLSSVSVAGE